MRFVRSGLVSMFFALGLLGLSLPASAQKRWDEQFTVYMLDPGGSFIQALSNQINQLLPLSYMPDPGQNLELQGEIILKLEGSLTDQVDFYTVSRPWQTNNRVDMDSGEVYQLVVVRQPELLTPARDSRDQESYHFSKQGSSWYAEPYGTLVTRDSGHQTMILSNGVLSMLNIENTYKQVIKGKPHQFMEMIGGVARQADFLALLSHPNIIKLQSNPDIVISLPLLEYFDNNLQDLLRKPGNITLPQILEQMTQLAGAMVYMHRASVAHGEIALENILLRYDPDLHMVLSNFGRASKVDAVSDSHTLGRKKFTFYNKHSSPPEMRLPKGPARDWEYTPATLKGDIWSFGFMLAAIMHVYPETHGLVGQFQFNQPLKNFYVTAEGKPTYDPARLAQKANTAPLTGYIEQSRLKTQNESLPQSTQKKAVFDALVRLVNRTTQFNPRLRPAAVEVAAELERITHRLQAVPQ